MANLKEKVESFFDFKDVNKNGYLDRNEIRNLLKDLSGKYNAGEITDSNIEAFMLKYDENNDDRITRDEFITKFMNLNSNNQRKPAPLQIDESLRDILANAFKSMDLDTSGFISFQEFQTALSNAADRHNTYFDDEQIRQHFDYFDRNHDGKILLEEFLKGSTQ